MSDIAQLGIEVSVIGASQASDSLNRVADSGSKAESSAISLTDALQGLASAWAIREVAQATYNIANIGAKYEMLGATMRVMANNAGYTGAAMEDFQTKLEETGISSLRARQSLQIMAAAQLDLAKSADLGRVAQDGATLAGINSSEAFQKLVQGISTGESRIIRHMGIMVNFKNTIYEYAQANHVAVESLSEHAKMQIRMQAVLEEGSKRTGVYEMAMSTAGKQMLSMQRYTENLQVQLGETFNPATNALVFELVKQFKDASESMKEWKESGDQAVFSANLRADMKGIIESVETFVGVLYEARASIGLIATLFATGYLIEWGIAAYDSFHKFLYAGVEAHTAVAAAKMKDVAATAAQATADVQAVMAERAAQGGRAITNAMRDKIIVAKVVETEATHALAIAEAELAATTTLAGQAAAMASTAMSALGGPLGILMIAIAGVIYLYNQMKDKTLENSTEVIRASQDAIDKMTEEAKMLEKLHEIRNNKQSTKEEKSSAEEKLKLENLPEYKKQTEDLETLRKKYIEVAEEVAFFNETTNQWEMYSNKGEKDALALAVAAAEEKLKALRDAHARLTDARKQDEKDRLANSNTGDDAETEKAQKLLYFKTQLAAMQDKINKAEFVGLEYSKLYLDILKIQEDGAKQIAGYKARSEEVNPKTGTAMLGSKEYTALVTKAREEMDKLTDAAVRANNSVIYDKMVSNTIKLRESLDDYGKSFDDVTITKFLRETENLTDSEGNLLSLETRMNIARVLGGEYLKNYWAQQVLLNDANEIYANGMSKINEEYRKGALSLEKYLEQEQKLENDRSGGRLENTMTAMEKYIQELAKLDAYLAGGGKIEIYNRSLIKLKLTSEDAWAGAANALKGYTDQTSSLLADYFNGVAGNWHDMFSKMAHDMEAAMLKAIIMKPIMDGLAASISSLTSGGNMSVWEAFLSGSGWGGNGLAAPGAPAQSTWGMGSGGGSGDLPAWPTASPNIVPSAAMVNAAGQPSISKMGASGGISINSTIIVQDGQVKGGATANQSGADIAKDFEGMMNSWALKNSRPGGLFNQIRSA